MWTIRRLLHLLVISTFLTCRLIAAPGEVTIEWENIGSASAIDGAIQIEGGATILNAAVRIPGESGTFQTPYVSGRRYIARWRNVAFGTIQYQEPVAGCDGCTIELVFNGGGGPVAPDWKYDVCFTNKSNFPMVIHLEDDAGLTYTGSIRTIPAGGYTCYNLQFPTKRDIQVHRDYFRDANGDMVTTSVYTIGSGDPDWYQGSDSPESPPGDSLDDEIQPDTESKNGGAVDFDTGIDPATEQTLQTGFNALHKVTVSGLSAVQSELSKVNANLNDVEQAIASGFVNINGTMLSVNSAVGALGTKLDAANAKLDTANTAASTQNTKLDTVNGNLDSIESGIGVLNNSIDALETKADLQISAMISNVVATAAGFNTLSNKLPVSANRLASNDDVAQVKNSVDIVNQTLQNQNPLSSLNSIYDRLAYYGNQANTDASGIANHLNDISADGRVGTNLLGQIKSALDGVRAAIEGQTNADSGTHTRLDEVKEVLETAAGNTNAMSFNVSSAENAGRNAAEAGEEQIDGMISGIGLIDYGAPVGSAYVPLLINIAGEPIDFNPMNIEGMSGVALWVSNLFGWLSALLTVNYMLKLTLASINAAGAFNQVRFSFMNSLGFGVGGVVGAATATLIAAAISVLFGAILVFAATYMGTGGDLIIALSHSPMVSSHPSVQQGIFILLEFFPFATVIANICIGMLYSAGLTKIMWVSQTVVRFFIG